MTWKEDKKVLDFMRSLKHNSATIENDVRGAFESAESLDDFKDAVKGAMEDLYHETNTVINEINDISCTVEVEK